MSEGLVALKLPPLPLLTVRTDPSAEPESQSRLGWTADGPCFGVEPTPETSSVSCHCLHGRTRDPALVSKDTVNRRFRSKGWWRSGWS